MQPNKAKKRHFGPLLLQPIPRRVSLRVPLPSYAQVKWTELSYQLKPTWRVEVPTDSARRRRY